jgi:hypothetical protein
MTRIAVCFSGQIRTGVHNYQNIKRFLGDLYDSCDFFVYTSNAETYTVSKFASQTLLDAGIPPHTLYPISFDTISQFYSLYMPRTMVVNDYKSHAHCADINMHRIMNSYNLMKEYSKINSVNYDYVVITRPDASFDITKSLKDDIIQVADDRTFCYARQHDAPGNPEHIESIYWLAKPFTMDIVSGFELVMRNRHYDNIGLDGFVHLYRWITSGLGLHCKRLENSKTAVYRWKHYESGISSLDSWKKFIT